MRTLRADRDRHGRFLHGERSNEFHAASERIDGDAISWLLSQAEWRGNLTGAWFAGVRGGHDFVQTIGDRLLASERVYAGQGYCFFFALQPSVEAERWLCDHLDVYLDRPDLDYDQAWAVAALRSVSRRLGSVRTEYLDPNGGWDEWRRAAHPDRWEAIDEAPVDALLRLLGRG